MNATRGMFVSVFLAAVATDAVAQNSVTLYGAVDSGIGYVSNSGGKSKVELTSGVMSTPRWGLRGVESLGSGWSTIFQLENGFNIGTGQLNNGGREFGRQAFVGLSQENYGRITLGRQYDPIRDFIQPITGDGQFGGMMTPGDVDNNDNDLRFSNSVKYASPIFSGLQIEAMYALGGVPGSFTTGSGYAGAVLYSSNGLNLAGGYFFVKNDNLASSTTSGFIGDSSLTAFATSPGSFQTAHAAASYLIGKVTVGVRYSNSQYKPYGATLNFPTTAKFNVGGTYVAYQFAPDLKATVNYVYMRETGVSSAHYNQVNAGVDYLLSKTTDIYAIAGYTKAAGETRINGVLVEAQANVGDFDIASKNNKQAIASVGLRHKF
jgi:predicted porin